MKKILLAFVVLLPVSVFAQTPAEPKAPPAALSVVVDAVEHNGFIPTKFAYCAPDGKGHTQNGGNINPTVRWSKGPEGTKSYAVIVVDPDVPTNFDNANKDGRTIPIDMPRQDFYHWGLINIPVSLTGIHEGQDSKQFIDGGKKTGNTGYGMNAQNDYAKFYKGPYGGYDGPCPPWNDERMHRYHFIVYALSVEKLNMGKGVFTAKEAHEALAAHVLAKGESVGIYSNNPRMAPK